MSLKLITPPDEEPLTPAEVRLRLGISSSVTDAMLNPLIKAARQEIDGARGWLNGRCLITQTWDLLWDAFPSEHLIKIPLAPLQTVDGVFYIDADGLQQQVDAENYVVDPQDDEAWIVPVSSFSWPAPMTLTNAVRIRFTAGYGDAGEDVPEPLRQWICSRVNISRTMSSSDAGLRSETVEGIGSRTWSTGSDFTSVLRESMDSSISTYRIMVC